MATRIKWVLIIFGVVFLILGCFFGFKLGSEIFQSLGIGFGAVSGGLGGLAAFLGWWEKENRKESTIQGLKEMFPRKDKGKTYDIIQPKFKPGWIHLLDKRQGKKIKHWIKDVQTLRAFGFSGQDAITVDDDEFNKYEEGEEIG